MTTGSRSILLILKYWRRAIQSFLSLGKRSSLWWIALFDWFLPMRCRKLESDSQSHFEKWKQTIDQWVQTICLWIRNIWRWSIIETFYWKTQTFDERRDLSESKGSEIFWKIPFVLCRWNLDGRNFERTLNQLKDYQGRRINTFNRALSKRYIRI